MAEIAKIKGYDIRDKKLADATSKTAVENTDSIRMKDTNGNEVFIARDSFVEAVRSVLGGLVTNLDKGTGASGIACVDSNNDLGTITPANLASVLSAVGVDTTDFSSTYSGTFANAPDNKTVFVAADKTIANDGPTTEIDYRGFLTSRKLPNSPYRIQVFMGANNGDSIFYRLQNGAGLSPWMEMLNVYKGTVNTDRLETDNIRSGIYKATNNSGSFSGSCIVLSDLPIGRVAIAIGRNNNADYASWYVNGTYHKLPL